VQKQWNYLSQELKPVAFLKYNLTSFFSKPKIKRQSNSITSFFRDLVF
jgi:hypothetical protein